MDMFDVLLLSDSLSLSQGPTWLVAQETGSGGDLS